GLFCHPAIGQRRPTVAKLDAWTLSFPGADSMSTIAACPRCSQQVSIPIDVAPTATVRCPHCQVEYHLQEALSRIPPLLILVDAGPSAKSDSGIFGMPGLAEPDHSLPPAAPLMGLGAVEDVPPESETQFSPHWHPAPPVPPAAGESDFV